MQPLKNEDDVMSKIEIYEIYKNIEELHRELMGVASLRELRLIRRQLKRIRAQLQEIEKKALPF
jgi:hypothetical protein